MAYIEPKVDFQDGEVLYGNDLNASNAVIKAGVDDNFDRIQGLDTTKQDVLIAGEGIQIENNVISNTNISAVWGNIQGEISNQTDLQIALGDKVDKVEGKALSTNDYTDAEKTKLGAIEAGAETNVIEDVKIEELEFTYGEGKTYAADMTLRVEIAKTLVVNLFTQKWDAADQVIILEAK